MKRLIDYHLLQWKVNPHRKPLMLRGARQVGKTFAARQLGRTFSNFIEINFEFRTDLKTLFTIEQLFNEIPRQLGGKFKYSKVEGEYRKRELAPCLELLTTAGVIHCITPTSGQGTPIGAGSDPSRFKVIFSRYSFKPNSSRF